MGKPVRKELRVRVRRVNGAYVCHGSREGGGEKFGARQG